MLFDLLPSSTRATLPHGRPRPRPHLEAQSPSTCRGPPPLPALLTPHCPLSCTLCALYAALSAISVLRFFPSSSAQPLCFLSHPCNPSSFMRLRTLLRNGTPLSLLFSMASALFLSPRGCTLHHSRRSDVWTCKHANSFTFKRLPPLCCLLRAPVLCFQSLGASFPKTPGWGVGSSSSILNLARHSPLSGTCLPNRLHGGHEFRDINANHRALPRVAFDFQAEIGAVQHAQPL